LTKFGDAWPTERAQFVKCVETEEFIAIMSFFVKMEVFIAMEIPYRLKNVRKAEWVSVRL
jgi:hypothetical protein